MTRTFERPLLLERTIKDVLAQNFGDWHLSIANNGGDPAPVEALVDRYSKELAGRVTVSHLTEPSGMQRPCNVAVDAPPYHDRGRYIAIHDDDDTWDPSFLERMVAKLDVAGDDVDGVACRCDYVEERIVDGRIEETERRPHTPNLWVVSIADVLADCPFPPIAFLYRRSAHERLGGYRDGTLVADDWDFLIRMLRDARVEVIPETLADYRHRPGAPDDPYSNSVQKEQQMIASRQMIRDRLAREAVDGGEIGYGHLLAGITPVDRDTLALSKDIARRLYELQLIVGDIEFRLRQVHDLVQRHDPQITHIERNVTLKGKIRNVLRSVKRTLRRG